jgi:RNA polymerase sigma-70 factor (ECF subfamily)
VKRTSLNLVEQLQQTDEAAWRRFVELYTPLIRGWLRNQCRLDPADADDLTQSVMQVVIAELPQFEHNRQLGAFRCWLRSITVNRLRSYWRGRRERGEGESGETSYLDELADPDSELSRQWDHEHDASIAGRLLERVKHEFEPRTWDAFYKTVLDNRSTAEVAEELGTTANAVLIAKSRVLGRLRKEIAQLDME